MSTTAYRACYYTDGQSETVLTLPEHVELSDDALREEAVAEAHRADIVGEDNPRITETVLRGGLRIGDWERW